MFRVNPRTNSGLNNLPYCNPDVWKTVENPQGCIENFADGRFFWYPRNHPREIFPDHPFGLSTVFTKLWSLLSVLTAKEVLGRSILKPKKKILLPHGQIVNE